MRPLTVLFYGRAGCGKGTQVELLKKVLEERNEPVLPVETGAAFRSFIAGNSYTSKLVKQQIDEGGLPPVFLPVWLWTSVLVEKYTGKEHLLIDGFPRRILESDVLEGMFEVYKRPPAHVIVLNVSSDAAFKRLRLRKREDDMSDEQIEKRLRWYDTDVMSTIEHLRTKPAQFKVIEINGEQPIEEVHAEVLKALQLSS